MFPFLAEPAGWIAALYLVASLLCFIAYALDKSSAVAGRRRISERMLLTLGFIGGWPGGLLAQRLLRHKTRKASFLTAFWLSVVVNLVVLAALWKLLKQ